MFLALSDVKILLVFGDGTMGGTELNMFILMLDYHQDGILKAVPSPMWDLWYYLQIA